MCTRIKIFRYLVTGCHNCQVCSSSAKTEGSATICAHQNAIMRAIFKNVLGVFYRGWFVVVHPCSNFSLSRGIAPLQSVKFQTMDFLIFCAHIIVIFWTTCIHCVQKKTPTYFFNYNSGISWSIFIIFVSVEREMNNLQSTYLQSWWRHKCVTLQSPKFTLWS